MEALSQRIPLNEIYEVKDCFCDNAANQYCGVTLEVKDPTLLMILNIKKTDRILKVYNKEGEIVYQRIVVPIDDHHLKTATNSKYTRFNKDQGNLSVQDEERLRYPLIALFQNILIMDPREQVPTGNMTESEQSILNVIRLDHKKGTKILKLRFQDVPIEKSLDLFANVTYLDGHMLFLTETLEAKTNKRN